MYVLRCPISSSVLLALNTDKTEAYILGNFSTVPLQSYEPVPRSDKMNFVLRKVSAFFKKTYRKYFAY